MLQLIKMNQAWNIFLRIKVASRESKFLLTVMHLENLGQDFKDIELKVEDERGHLRN